MFTYYKYLHLDWSQWVKRRFCEILSKRINSFNISNKFTSGSLVSQFSFFENHTVTSTQIWLRIFIFLLYFWMFSCTGINGSSISILANSLHHSTALTELSFNFGYANYFTLFIFRNWNHNLLLYFTFLVKTQQMTLESKILLRRSMSSNILTP